MKSPGVELSAAKLILILVWARASYKKTFLKENIFQGYWILVVNCYLAILPLSFFFCVQCANCESSEKKREKMKGCEVHQELL